MEKSVVSKLVRLEKAPELRQMYGAPSAVRCGGRSNKKGVDPCLHYFRPLCSGPLYSPVGYVFYNVVLSPDNWVYKGNYQWKDGGYHAAPGPLAGASLPVLAVGYGVYWLVRRRRKAD